MHCNKLKSVASTPSCYLYAHAAEPFIKSSASTPSCCLYEPGVRTHIHATVHCNKSFASTPSFYLYASGSCIIPPTRCSAEATADGNARKLNSACMQTWQLPRTPICTFIYLWPRRLATISIHHPVLTHVPHMYGTRSLGPGELVLMISSSSE